MHVQPRSRKLRLSPECCSLQDDYVEVGHFEEAIPLLFYGSILSSADQFTYRRMSIASKRFIFLSFWTVLPGI